MKKVLQNWLNYMVFAVGIGSMISTAAITMSMGMTEELRQVIIWIVASAVIGLVSMIYEVDGLPDVTATLIHAPLTVLVALIAGSIAGYGEGSLVLLITRMLVPIVILYVAIHLLMFVIRRFTVRNLNDKLSGK